MRLHQTIFAVFAAGLLAAAPQAIASQQEGLDTDVERSDFDLEFRAGPTIPANEIADFVDPGVQIGANAAWHMSDAFAVTAGGAVDMLSGNDDIPTAPGLSLWHLNVGAEYELGATEGPLSTTVIGGFGATNMDSEDFATAPGDFSETYAHMNAGLELGYALNQDVTLALRGTGYFILADEDETAALVDDDEILDPFGTAVTLPITAEVQIALGG